MSQEKRQSGLKEAESVSQARINALLADAQSGSEQKRKHAQKMLLSLMSDSIFRFCLSHLRHQEDAVEASQETAYRLLRKWHDFHGDARWQTWVFGIALNVCREMYRKRKRVLINTEMVFDKVTDNEATETLDQELESKEQQASLLKALDVLSDRQREVVTLRYLEAMSVAETAVVMNVAEGTVKATLSQALKKLKAQLTQDARIDARY